MFKIGDRFQADCFNGFVVGEITGFETAKCKLDNIEGEAHIPVDKMTLIEPSHQSLIQRLDSLGFTPDSEGDFFINLDDREITVFSEVCGTWHVRVFSVTENEGASIPCKSLAGAVEIASAILKNRRES